MTATIAPTATMAMSPKAPMAMSSPLLLQLLSDRSGTPTALLVDAVSLTVSAASPALRLLQELASGSMGCYYHRGTDEALGQLLDEAGWKPLAAEQIVLRDSAPASAPASAMGNGAVWIAGDWWLAAPSQPVGNQAASRALALKLVQLVADDAATHEIETLLRQDPTLSYHLLRLVNSLGIASGRRVTSFSQAILILGRSQLRRWLNLMLFSARLDDPRSAMLLARVALRARALELLAKSAGHDRAQQEQAFMIGMFSLLGVLFGMPLAELLQPLTLADAVQQALLARVGVLGQLLDLVVAAERCDAAAVTQGLQSLQIEVASFNTVQMDAHLWMQAVIAGKASKAGTQHA